MTQGLNNCGCRYTLKDSNTGAKFCRQERASTSVARRRQSVLVPCSASGRVLHKTRRRDYLLCPSSHDLALQEYSQEHPTPTTSAGIYPISYFFSTRVWVFHGDLGTIQSTHPKLYVDTFRMCLVRAHIPSLSCSSDISDTARTVPPSPPRAG